MSRRPVAIELYSKTYVLSEHEYIVIGHGPHSQIDSLKVHVSKINVHVS